MIMNPAITTERLHESGVGFTSAKFYGRTGGADRSGPKDAGAV